ncbi:hypothetical protein EB008_02505 [bacterium]|nr:hypothetical protein [bacterium]
MKHHDFIPHFLSPLGEVIGTEKEVYRVLFKELPKTFLGFHNPIENFLLDPNINCRLLGACFQLLSLEKNVHKNEIILEIKSAFPLGVGRKVARIFIKDDRFRVQSKRFVEELQKERLVDFNSNSLVQQDDGLILELNSSLEAYRIPPINTPLTDFSETQIEKILIPDPAGTVVKYKAIKHETLFLVSDFCLQPQNSYVPLLYHNNSVKFALYKESEYKQKISFFSERGLNRALESLEVVQEVFSLTPNEENRSALFLTSNRQLKEPLTSFWLTVPSSKVELPPVIRNERHHQLLEQFIHDQPETAILESILNQQINSEGVLFVTYLPSFFLRGLFFQRTILKKLKRIYFMNPSKKTPGYFSHADRSFLLDLNAHGIEVFWYDKTLSKLLQFCERVLDYTGIFLPPNRIEEYHRALTIGIYGSSCVSKDIEGDIREILLGLETMKIDCSHPLLNPHRTLAVSTGGGPGVMGIANKVAFDLKILSLAHLCNFSFEPMNPHVDGKMTYRIERMIERQAEFLVKLPIFFIGGYGTDLELALEVVGRQVGSYEVTPILLFGDVYYWEQKITSRFTLNHESGTLRTGEYLSNCLIQVSSGSEAVEVYKHFFKEKLQLGTKGRIYLRGFRLFKEIYDDV